MQKLKLHVCTTIWENENCVHDICVCALFKIQSPCGKRIVTNVCTNAQKKFKSKSLIKIVILGIIPSMGNIAYRFLGLSS